MKEPKRIPLDPSTPRIQDVEKRPLPSLAQESDQTYPEPMKDDVFEKESNAEEAFSNFIQKAKESKKKYDLWVQSQKKDEK